MKLQPSTYLRESCASVREGRCEALTAVHVAGAIEHRKIYRLGRRDSHVDRRQHVIHRNGERDYGPTVSKNPGTHARTLPGPGRSPFHPGVVYRVVQGRWKTPKPVMYEMEKSDRGIVVMKAANKGVILRSCWSEGPDPRGSWEILPHAIR